MIVCLLNVNCPGPAKEMDDVAFLPWIPPLKKIDLHARLNQRLARLLDLYLKTTVGQGKRLQMIE
jgi:hypothetical protein